MYKLVFRILCKDDVIKIRDDYFSEIPDFIESIIDEVRLEEELSGNKVLSCDIIYPTPKKLDNGDCEIGVTVQFIYK